jgi:hypothetical protein
MTDNNTVKIGDHFASSWGYDQTNVDFYEVVGLTPKGVRLRRVKKRVEGHGVVPVPGEFVGNPFQTQLIRTSGPIAVSSPKYIGGGYASLWDGKPKHDTIALGYPGH